MPSFDVMERATPLFGAKLLEASAGTGKTYAIEHLFVRLLLEAPIGEEPLLLEQILAITFTRAAAREMRMRIRSNLEKALIQLQGEPKWPYLRPYAGEAAARHRLEDALQGFDRAQVFTIHGFCRRALSEFAIESGILLESCEEGPFRQQMRPALLDFLEKQTLLCPEQLGRLVQKRGGAAELCDALLNAPNPASGGSFDDDREKIAQMIEERSLLPSTEELFALFERCRGDYKTTGFKGDDLFEQLQCLARLLKEPRAAEPLRRLLFWQGSLLEFLAPDNRKVKTKEKAFPFFEWCSQKLLERIKTMLLPKRMMRILRFGWEKIFEKDLEERSLFSPDFLLQRMKKAIESEAFIARLRQKYPAAIVDEFQDTDDVQWEIFRKIFSGQERLFYLVGDPKQSIYRFRQADLYTYFRAKSDLGKKAFYSLDTNYRSSQALIGALNDFFGDRHVEPWLWLPKEQIVEAYRPVKAGADLAFDPKDGKKALQFFSAESTLAYVADEIVRLRPTVASFRSFAVLVKDRYGALAAENFLKSRSLPCYAKTQTPIGRSLACHALEELFEAVYFPHDASRLKIFLSGPLIAMPVVPDAGAMPFLPEIGQWKEILEKEGLPAFFRAFFRTKIHERTMFEQICQGSLYCDFMQIIEELLSIRTPTREAIKRFFSELKAADPDDDESARRRQDNDADAIEIMTMHASKGLEFDVVFALGVAAKTPRDSDEPDEAEAEKMRQLYVALTRAKIRLYIPLIDESRQDGAESPLEVFWRRSRLGKNPQEIVAALSAMNPEIGMDYYAGPISGAAMADAPLELIQPPEISCRFPKRQIFSYSALAQGDEASSLAANLGEEKTIHTLPRGADTGILLHRVFERVFSGGADAPRIVGEELRFTALEAWQNAILRMVQRVADLSFLPGCRLNDTERKTEIEFLFAEGPHFFKGFIDLAFQWQGRLYFLDWKTNYLGDQDAAYTEEALRRAMDEGDYWFQASLYAEALRRAYPKTPFGGALYLFTRGVFGPMNGLLSFQPSPLTLDRRL